MWPQEDHKFYFYAQGGTSALGFTAIAGYCTRDIDWHCSEA